MLNVESKPTIFVDKPRNLIIINGHYSDVARCAKLTLLCEKYGAKNLKEGYAEVPYNEDFLNDLKFVNENTYFIAPIIIAAIIGAAVAGTAAATGGIGMGASGAAASGRNSNLKKWLRTNYPDLTQAEIDALISQYGDLGAQSLFDFAHWGDQSDPNGLAHMMRDLEKAYEEIGARPEDLTLDQLNEIENQANAEIDAENQQILDLYTQNFNRSNNLLQEQLLDNQQMFSDYRNQLLTNDAMQQQMIAGSTRYELDRQQRNAIVRGASAAQRLVANINTQLGMQSKAAQQSLDTSNALAQQLLMHRQAQANLRSSYIDNLNQEANNRASLLRGSVERKGSYARDRLDYNLSKNQYAQDAWDNRVNDYFSGNSLGSGIYRRRYGSTNNQNNKY